MKSDMPPRGWSAFGGKSDFPRGVLTPDHPSYPLILKQVIKPALPVYYRGNVSLLKESKKLSAIGSRNITETHERALRHMLGGLHDVPLTIVSGLALGLDALAHTIALENDLLTIAVLGSSIEPEEIYPSFNAQLSESILKSGGLLISPFPAQTEIQKWNFPIRNQFIAALSDATLVGSAAKKSGALITARLALEYGKDVFVIPGSTDDPLYEGSNTLLQQGAYPILSSNDLLEYFEFGKATHHRYVSDDPLLQKAVELLRAQTHTANGLAAALRLTGSETNVLLSKLELQGWISIAADGTIQLQ